MQYLSYDNRHIYYCFSMVPDLLAVAAIICIAAFLQSISGFGFSLLAMPLLSVFVDIHDAVVIATLCGIFTNAVHLKKDLHLVERSVARRISLSALIGMPLGVVVLSLFSATQMRVIIGAVTVVLVFLMMRHFVLKVENTRSILPWVHYRACWLLLCPQMALLWYSYCSRNSSTRGA